MEDGGKDLLLETMDDWEQKQADLKCLLSAWQQGDDTTLTNMSTYFENTTQFAESMLFERNRDWVEQLNDPNKFKKGLTVQSLSVSTRTKATRGMCTKSIQNYVLQSARKNLPEV